MHRVVVGVDGGFEVDVVVGVVFVTCSVVVTVFGVDEVVFELGDELDEDDDEELDDELEEVCSVGGGALNVGAADEVVLSVATCSSRSGGLCSDPEALMPMPNNAATAAPRKAPTARRNGAPGWSSTRYLYRVNPIGSSKTEKDQQKTKPTQPTPAKQAEALSRGAGREPTQAEGL